MPKIIIASTNPVKIACVKNSFEKVFPEIEFEFLGISAASEVRDQPMSNKETKLGAQNRIKNAKILEVNADFWVAIEGGIEQKKLENSSENVENKVEMEVFAYILVASRDNIGESKTATFVIPHKVGELINQGFELGTADDMVFGGENSKQKNGSVGILTKDLITRTSFYENSVILALIPFMNEDLY